MNTKSAIFTAIMATFLLSSFGSFAQVQPSQPTKSQAKQVSETSDKSSVTDASSDQDLQLLRKDLCGVSNCSLLCLSKAVSRCCL